MSRNRARWIVLLATALFVLVAGASTSTAETVYVRSKGVQLRSGTNAAATVVKELPLGADLTVLRRQGMWIQVKDKGGATGWVHKLKVSQTKPEQGGGVFEDMGLGGSSDQYVQEARAGRGVRGLSDLAKEYAKGKKISAQDVKAVEWMEGYRTGQREVQQFLKQGGVGEVAGNQ